MRPYERATGLTLLVLVLACEKTADPKAAPGAAASVSATVAVKLPPTAGSAAPAKKKWAVPTGPRLALEAGVGAGPIRLGATLETVERQMDLKCPEASPAACRYVTRAVEFFFDDAGQVNRLRVHRQGRPAGPASDGTARSYGIFNGGLTQGVQLGMLLEFSKRGMGAPLRVETVSDASDGFHTQERHHYDGLILEYDKLPETGTVVLGGVTIIPKGKK